MAEASYYKNLGFRCGLEIHQRLDTDEKLFCACSTEQSSDGIGKVYRMQRAVAGELGSIDMSAQFEESKRRRFEYNLFRESTCLVDADEEPPHDLNREALTTALSLACSMRMNIIHEIEPMRKGVVDGSDTSAFQRTMLVGFDGSITVGGHDILIPSVCLEEESCGIEKDYGTEIAYNVDRLGIPLIEVATFADIPTPEAAKETALYIGTLLRLTGKVKRGIGTIRQDVNVSIADGARIEIKGLQDVSMLDRFVENEVRRQAELADIAKLLKKAGAKVGKVVDVTKVFEGTKVSIIRSKLEKEGRCLAFPLSGFKGLLGREVNPNRRLGTEISDYAKTVGAGGIIHSDENLEAYGFDAKEIAELQKALGSKDSDSFVMIAEKVGIAENAIEKARWRAAQSIEGVPVETRVAINDVSCTSRFTRPLPGGSRMYPETDVRPILVDERTIAAARLEAPDLEREVRTLTYQLKDDDLVRRMIKSTRLQAYKEIVKSTKADSRFVANVLLQRLTELSRGGYAVDEIDVERMVELFNCYHSGRITKQAVDEVIKRLSEEDRDVSGIVKELGLARITGSRLVALVGKLRKELKTTDANAVRNATMAKYRLNVDGEELNRLLS